MTPLQRKKLEEVARAHPGAIVGRIKPSCGRKTQVVDGRIFKLEQDWVGPIRPGLRSMMEGCIINEMDPYSESVFQFCPVETALAQADRQESKRHGATPPATVPRRVEGVQPSSVEDLIAEKVAAAMAAATAGLEEKLAAAREEGAAAERARRRKKPKPKAEPPAAEPKPRELTEGDEPPAEPAAPPAE